MKLFLIKIILFLGLVALSAEAFDMIYFSTRMNMLYPKLDHMNKLLDQKVDVILFGSSVNRFTDSLDTDSRSIDEMMNDLLPDMKVGALSHTAYHLDLFAEYVGYISAQEHKPILIIPINLRTFSPTWDLRPTYQFNFEKQVINHSHALLRFMELNQDTNWREEAFKNHPVYHQGKQIGKVSEFTAPYSWIKDPTKGFIIHYMQQISPESQKLNSLERIQTICKENNIPLLLYLTPIDYTHGERLEIPGFRNQVDANLSLIKQVIRENNGEVYDFSKALDSSYFSYPHLPNEHLKQKGRMFLASSLSDKVLEKVGNPIAKR